MKTLSETGDIIRKIRLFCSYQERCSREVEDKLKSWAVQKQYLPSILLQLRREEFLDEKRFAKSFARGKFRLNKWGRQKIEFEMKLRGLSDPDIAEGIREIDDAEYKKVLRELISRKYQEIKEEKNLNVREKIINFAFGKGYEMKLILQLLKEMQI